MNEEVIVVENNNSTIKQKNNKIGISIDTLQKIINHNPFIILRIFALEEISKIDTILLLTGSLLPILEEKYALPIKKSFIPFPLTGTSQRVVLSLVWALGSLSVDIRNLALRSLKIYCTFMLANSWVCDNSGGSNGSDDNNNGHKIQLLQNLDANVSIVLNSNFLYLYTNAVQKNWTVKHFTIQMHSLRALSSLLTLLQSDDLVKYLPKVYSCFIFYLSPFSFLFFLNFLYIQS